MNSKLQKVFDGALAAVQNNSARKPNKQMPIYRRPEKRSERQAVKDAAVALSALWKMNTPSFKS